MFAYTGFVFNMPQTRSDARDAVRTSRPRWKPCLIRGSLRLSALPSAATLPAKRYISRATLIQVDAAASQAFKDGVLMGEMKRATSWENQQQQKQDRFASTLTIAASIIAAVRLARDDISTRSPRVRSVIAESVALARMILDRVAR